MKKILCAAAALSLAAPAAFGQADGSRAAFDVGGAREFRKAPIIFLPGAGAAPEVALVAKAVRDELERSRQLEPVYVDDDQRPRLVAPTALTKDATGEKMTVSIELRTARKKVENVDITCAVNKPANCGRDIVIRAEKFIRDNKNR